MKIRLEDYNAIVCDIFNQLNVSMSAVPAYEPEYRSECGTTAKHME